VIWTLAVAVLLGSSAPAPRADARLRAGRHPRRVDGTLGAEVDHASAFYDV
jgi:hypothetical protein